MGKEAPRVKEGCSSSPRVSAGNTALLTDSLILEFWSPGLCENVSIALNHQGVVMCYIRHRKLIQYPILIKVTRKSELEENANAKLNMLRRTMYQQIKSKHMMLKQDSF